MTGSQRASISRCMAPVTVNTVCFRLRPRRSGAQESGRAEAGRDQQGLLDEVNATGRIYMTHTKLNGSFTLRLCVGQAKTRREHVVEAWECLQAACGHAAVRFMNNPTRFRRSTRHTRGRHVPHRRELR